MILYRAMKSTQSNKILPKVPSKNSKLDLIYSHVVPSHNENDVVWSFTPSYAEAKKWVDKSRGEGKYDRIGYMDFDGTEGVVLNLTNLETWIFLMQDKSSSDYKIKNLNTGKRVEYINAIVPCSRSVLSMSRACMEYAVIPSKEIELITTENEIQESSKKLTINSSILNQDMIKILQNQLKELDIVIKSFVNNWNTELECA